jgi:hypothetical protein
MQASLCILAHNGHEEAAKLIESIRGIYDLEVEVVVGFQSCSPESLLWYQKHADMLVPVSDRELWERGFGYCRQKIADAAEHDWIISADCGEVWHENPEDGGLVYMLEHNPGTPVFRVARGEPDIVRQVIAGEAPGAAIMDDNGRIFDRREMQWAGMIHEALFHIGLGAIWASWARRFAPLAFVEHSGMKADEEDFRTRKQVLYDHLIHTIVHDPRKRFGTDHYWWTAYWNTVVKPRFKEVSFEEWQEMGG